MSNLGMQQPAPELPDDTPLAEVELPVRIRNALSAAGLKTTVRSGGNRTGRQGNPAHGWAITWKLAALASKNLFCLRLTDPDHGVAKPQSALLRTLDSLDSQPLAFSSGSVATRSITTWSHEAALA